MSEQNRASAKSCVIVGDQTLTIECAELARARGLVVNALVSRHALAASWAREHGVELRTQDGLAEALDGLQAEALLSIANLRIVPGDVLDRFRFAVNFHDGPLPERSGVFATSWAVLDDATEHAITWHVMTREVDGGDIIVDDRWPVGSHDSAYSLNTRCFDRAVTTFPVVVERLLAGDLKARRQAAGGGVYRGPAERPAAIVATEVPARTQARWVRALDFGGRVDNALGVVRLIAGGAGYVVVRAHESAHDEPLGDGLRVPTVEGTLVVDEVTNLLGAAVPLPRGVIGGAGDAVSIGADHESLLRSERAALRALGVPRCGVALPTSDWHRCDIAADRFAEVALAIVASRLFEVEQLAVAVGRAPLGVLMARPLAVVDVNDASQTAQALESALASACAAAAERGPWLLDAVARTPSLRQSAGSPPIGPLVAIDHDAALPRDPFAPVQMVVSAGRATLWFATSHFDHAAAFDFAERVQAACRSACDEPATALRDIDALSARDGALLTVLNDTAGPGLAQTTVPAAFRAQVERTPHHLAVTAGDVTFSYAQLADRVSALRRGLVEAGVSRGSRVGLCLGRGEHLVPAVLAVLECGAAYVPLDPAYPIERLHYMVGDADLDLLLSDDGGVALTAPCPQHHPAELYRSDVAGSELSISGTAAPSSEYDASGAAYVIYTSGSTGRPKGVVVEHRNVMNFFAGMDDHLEVHAPGTWLAVTSLSFDISVLELLWTLCRGYHVVVKPSSAPRSRLSFSLFYFSSNASDAQDSYQLLLDGARFADEHGFDAVWTPERHFHEFGGSYANAAVTAAAVAAVTTRISVRAGSVVLPLHNSIRVAEEWAMVDNLCGGRAGISFAAGWQPNDFVLNPGAYERGKAAYLAQIDEVKALWRGETIELPGPLGPVAVRTLPRPVQAELPVWLTSAGSIETFEAAGTSGANALTHLLGQSIDQLAGKIAAYRAARRAAGHAGRGTITLMRHTYLDADGDRARAIAREPMKEYLRSATGLLKDMASAFPTLRSAGADADEAFRNLTLSEIEQLLDAAADRYLHESGLFGSVDEVAPLAAQLEGIGVDEIACLVDFGVAPEQVVAGFGRIDELRRRLQSSAALSPTSGIGDLIDEHAVTHLQCTPSMAAMLLADPAERRGLARLRHLMVGGEAMTPKLARSLTEHVGGRLTNMYGPTETTVWSLVHEVSASDLDRTAMPIGRPLRNQTVQVLDRNGAPVAVGVDGELFIGGEGVTRGYHERPELTAARFVERVRGGRVYATGDRAQVGTDGLVHFGGRLDNQVKVRGLRIELGEIETALESIPLVAQAAVVAVPDEISTELAAFVLPHAEAALTAAEVRTRLSEQFPEPMVPREIFVVTSLPMMGNGKLDRVALARTAAGSTPPSTAVAGAVASATVGTERGGSADEALVLSLWSDALGRPLDRERNFFEAGGHSLLAVKVFRRLVDATALPVSLTDLFRFPNARQLGAHLRELREGRDVEHGATEVPAAVPGNPGADERGSRRRQALLARGRVR